MSYLDDAKIQLENVLDDGFPKIEEDWPKKRANKRGPALALYAEAILLIMKAVKAFGGCEHCYGKGYSTTTTDGAVTMRFCGCERGGQLADLLLPKDHTRWDTFTP